MDMKYRELIELYKKGKLEEEEKTMVENDIERHEAISEYLFSEGDIPEIKDLNGEDNSLGLCESNYLEEQEKDAVEFTKIVNSTIRKAFIKMGMVVGGVLLAILILVMSMPKIVDLFYYNPAEQIGDDGLTNRISLDFATYSEIFLPGKYLWNVIADSNGNGNYDVKFLQNLSFNDKYRDVAGKIEKGKLVLYDPNLLTRQPGNAFIASYANVSSSFNIDPSFGGRYEDAIEKLNDLDENDYYIAYITLDEVKNYESFVQWAKELKIDPLWCAICLKKDDQYYLDYYDDGSMEYLGHYGFIFQSSAGQKNYDKEAYPYLTTFDVATTTGEEKDWIASEEVMRTHVVSMFRYLADQKDFNKMISGRNVSGSYKIIADNVEKHGLNIYGFAVVAQKNTLIDISKVDGVAYIYTEPIN